MSINNFSIRLTPKFYSTDKVQILTFSTYLKGKATEKASFVQNFSMQLGDPLIEGSFIQRPKANFQRW